jgi:hypothetical protein
MYADDVVLFLSPKEQDLILARGILEIFARTSGLATNINKCLISPIHVISRPWCHCSIFSLASGKVDPFQITYLGIPPKN